MKNRCVCLVQARRGSTRLPEKILKEVGDIPLLEFIIKRLKTSKKIDEVIVATTTKPEDRALGEICKRNNVGIFFGSENDVLDRFVRAAGEKTDIVVRVCGDCPLVDIKLMDDMISDHMKKMPDITHSKHENGAIIGLSCEVITFKALLEANKKTKEKEDREHVVPYIYKNSRFVINRFDVPEKNRRKYWLTVDTPEDLELVKEIVKRGGKNTSISTDEIIAILDADPKLAEKNIKNISKIKFK